jgi:hypothetical protein
MARGPLVAQTSETGSPRLSGMATVPRPHRDHTSSAFSDVYGSDNGLSKPKTACLSGASNLSSTKDIWRGRSDAASVGRMPGAVLVAELEPETRDYLGRQLRDDGFSGAGCILDIFGDIANSCATDVPLVNWSAQTRSLYTQYFLRRAQSQLNGVVKRRPHSIGNRLLPFRRVECRQRARLESISCRRVDFVEFSTSLA